MRGRPAGAGVEGCLPTLQAAMADFVPGKTSRLEAVRKAFETRGCKPEWLALFDSHESFFSAFPNETFGRAEYRWDDETRPIEAVLSVVDCLVTLVEEEGVPACLAWDPIAQVRETTGWQAGGVHRPEVVERWERLPGCSKRVRSWVRERFWVPPLRPILTIRKRNVQCLRPHDKLFDCDKSAFV